MAPHPTLKPMIHRRFLDGSSAPQLAREFGVSPSTIYWWSSREKWGQQRHQPPAPTPRTHPRPRPAPPSDDLWFTRTWMAP